MGTRADRQPVSFANEGGRVAIQTGQYSVYGDSIVQHTKDSLKQLPYAVEAPFNAYTKQHEPTCLRDTRVNLLSEIYSWADGQDERRVFWLNGLAGTGKSTIARTVARHYFDKKYLAASFFFSRGSGDVSHAAKFVTSIAVQLAHNISASRRHICDAIVECSDIANQSLRDQWHHLVLRPLSKLDGLSAYILVVDALDECENDNNIRIIVKLLAEAQSLGSVRVFLTSRPEVPIRHGFGQIPNTEHRDFVLHNISPTIVDSDIHLFLQHSLQCISQEERLDASWPGKEAISTLVQNASGLFIWATTACHFIREGLFAEERLRILIDGGNYDGASTPEEHLNGIYITVLKTSVRSNYNAQEKRKHYNILQIVLGGIVTLFSPLSVESLSKTLLIPKYMVDRMLRDLHAILDIPDDQSRPLRLHHPSFRDFLLDKDRCGDFWVDESQAHQQLADNCIQVMSNYLKKDMCDASAPGAFVASMEKPRVEQCLPPELQYACCYWIQHLQKSGAQLRDNDKVHRFLKEHFLHWLEALGWMDKVSEGIHAIGSLELVVTTDDCPEMDAFVHDMKRFALYSRSAIEQAPLQTYCSALVFAPDTCLVKRHFITRQLPRWMKRLPQVDNDWGTMPQTLEGHSGTVSAVAFSPDGKVLASASHDRTVKVWNTATVVVLHTLKGHSEEVSAVVFSPDGKVLASAAWDMTVKLWDPSTGVLLRTLKGHLDRVVAVAFSPDSKVLASRSHDETIRLWDTSTGAVLQTLRGYLGRANAMTFSPDGRLLVLTSGNKMVELWDTSAGVVSQTLKSHLSYINTVAFSPNGKALASVSHDMTVKIWDASMGAVLHTLEGHSAYVDMVAFSPNGKVLALVSGNTFRLWYASQNLALQTLENRAKIWAVAFSPDSKLLALASEDMTVKLWDIAFSRDDELPSVAIEDSMVKIRDTGTRVILKTRESHRTFVTEMAFSPDGKVLASASFDKMVKLWDSATGVVLHTLKGHSKDVSAMAFSSDGKVLAAGSFDNTVKLWNTSTGALLHTLEGHLDCVKPIVLSPDDKMLASASFDKTIKLWNAGTGVTLHTLKGHSEEVSAMAFSSDGKVLASGSFDNTVKLWNTSTGALLHTLEGHLSYIDPIVLSPDDKVLASASHDKTIKLWDADTGAMLQTYRVGDYIHTLSFSEDGTLLNTNCRTIHTMLLPTKYLSQLSIPAQIFVEDQWIYYRGENILWLPPEYRTYSNAVHGNVVALGHISGRMSMLQFAS